MLASVKEFGSQSEEEEEATKEARRLGLEIPFSALVTIGCKLLTKVIFSTVTEGTEMEKLKMQ